MAAVSRGLIPEEGVVGDVIDTWSLSCSEAQVRCDVDITCRVLLETIDKVCDQSGMFQRRNSLLVYFAERNHALFSPSARVPTGLDNVAIALFCARRRSSFCLRI